MTNKASLASGVASKLTSERHPGDAGQSNQIRCAAAKPRSNPANAAHPFVAAAGG
ncbi:hypothetical protein [Paenibacillus ginsengarvi]|uniref:hypothetical protein n=1 Tax=Paenibacillus ginsengarvi TaxID=400777 RepID=UPI001315549D|nr:hypothetical protein [Paenibacillus ginsengarvi]